MDPNNKICQKNCEWSIIYSKRFGVSFPCIHTALSFNQEIPDLIPPTDIDESKEIFLTDHLVGWEFPRNSAKKLHTEYEENLELQFEDEGNDVFSFLMKITSDFCNLNGVKKSKEKMLSEISMQWAVQTSNQSREIFRDIKFRSEFKSRILEYGMIYES